MRILILNSSPDTCEMLAEYFSSQGWQPDTCLLKPLRTGDLTGQSLMAAYQPDAIILDVGIPYEANWSLLQSLRNDPHITCPVIVTTTNELALRRLVGVEERIQQVIGKPYDLDQLQHIVLSAIMGSREPVLMPTADRRGADRRVRDRRR